MKRNTKGFSLPELLIVVAIIGIITTIAVPGLLEAARASRESAAIQSLRTLVSAQNTYLSTKGGYNVYGDASQLTSSGLLDDSLLTAPRNRYTIQLSLGSPATTFTATAEPIDASPKNHYYFTANDGLIHWKAGSTAGPTDPYIPQ